MHGDHKKKRRAFFALPFIGGGDAKRYGIFNALASTTR